jgi:hypothetical protein
VLFFAVCSTLCYTCIGFVPDNFCRCYTVLLLKNLDCRSRSVSGDDFRSNAISSILFKAFEKCLLAVFDEYFITEENPFGFKKGLSCRHAVYSARRIKGHFVKGNSSVNLRAVDISKACDSVNHCIAFVELMERSTPWCLLRVFSEWFPRCHTCIKWSNCYSGFFPWRLVSRHVKYTSI